MKRAVEKELVTWKNKVRRTPILLRGARQVGKSFIVQKFGAEYFQNVVEINFELEPQYSACFDSLKPQDILTAIDAINPVKITKGETLLFLDEVQICPRAIMALRYFKEKMPGLHVIAAGSLIEFALHGENFSMPVGRVQDLYLKPLSFIEFLWAMGFDKACEALKTVNLKNPLPVAIHEKLLSLVRQYLLIGGMPEAVLAFCQTQNYRDSQQQQTILLNTYRNDFGKYAKKTDYQYLQKVFYKTPALLGEQIKYTHIDDSARARDLKEAIFNLGLAGVINPVFATKASGLPLEALVNEKKFKLLFLDVGLANRAANVQMTDLLNEKIILINKGAIAEQFVGQELLAYMDHLTEAKLHFWCRDKVGSQAEVDYVINRDSKILPIEVKAGATGRLKALQLFLQEKGLPLGLRISASALQMNDNVLSVSFYLISELPRLLEECRGDNNFNLVLDTEGVRT